MNDDDALSLLKDSSFRNELIRKLRSGEPGINSAMGILSTREVAALLIDVAVSEIAAQQAEIERILDAQNQRDW